VAKASAPALPPVSAGAPKNRNSLLPEAARVRDASDVAPTAAGPQSQGRRIALPSGLCLE
jgi:hypothetical protein